LLSFALVEYQGKSTNIPFIGNKLIERVFFGLSCKSYGTKFRREFTEWHKVIMESESIFSLWNLVSSQWSSVQELWHKVPQRITEWHKGIMILCTSIFSVEL